MIFSYLIWAGAVVLIISVISFRIAMFNDGVVGDDFFPIIKDKRKFFRSFKIATWSSLGMFVRIVLIIVCSFLI